MTVGGFHSALRPRRDTAAPGTVYLPVDAPFCEGGLSPAPMTIGLRFGADGRPQAVRTIEGDDGKDLDYVYTPVGETAMPMP